MTVKSLIDAACARHGLTRAGLAFVLGRRPRVLALWAEHDRVQGRLQVALLHWLAGTVDDDGLLAVHRNAIADAQDYCSDSRRRREPSSNTAT